MRIALAAGYARHHTGAGHPERPERLVAFIKGLESGGCSRDEFLAAPSANAAALLAVHSQAYVAGVERFCATLPGEDVVAELPTGDTNVSRASFEIALQAAGAVINAAEDAAPGEPTLAIVRPPGHHATPERGMGFCVFNNIAIAAQRMRTSAGPVLVADFDYHHGNGTQAWVERVLDGDDGAPLGFLSTHAYPAYPGTGAFGESRVGDNGFLIDVPLPLTTVTDDFVAVWAKLLPPLARRLKPSAILVSAGFDFLTGDPIAGLPVTLDAVDALCALFGEVASDAGASLTFVLEGGYSLENLAASGMTMAWAFGKGSATVSVPESIEPASPKLRAIVDETLRWL